MKPFLPGRNAGMTVLELLIAGLIFMVFMVGATSVWITSNKQIKSMLDRARLTREAYTARALLASDFSYAKSMELVPPDSFVLYTAAGSTISYTREGASLTRYEAEKSSMTAATHLQSMESNILSVYTSSHTFVFAKSSATINLQIYWNHLE